MSFEVDCNMFQTSKGKKQSKKQLHSLKVLIVLNMNEFIEVKELDLKTMKAKLKKS